MKYDRQTKRHFTRWLSCGISILGLLIFVNSASFTMAQETLKGQIQLERRAEPTNGMLHGRVIDTETGQPLQNASVTLPDLGFSMRTNSSGEYRIPRYLGKNPIIMSVEKPGYAPFSMSITEHAPPTFDIKLQKQLQLLVLDNQLRHLGDGSFSPASSNAFNFRKPPDGPALRISFSVEGLPLSRSPSLQIGSIIGLDTRMVHFLTGNILEVAATPLLVKLNGTIIAQVQVNGDNQRISIPDSLLQRSGMNILEIETGYHYPEPNRLDYDDMEFMHLVFYP